MPAEHRVLYVPLPTESGAVVYGIGHAGAGAAPWRAVAELLSPAVELRAYRPPGRENRFRETAHESIEAAAAELAGAVSGRLDDDGRPYLVAGICSGALIGRAALGMLARDRPEGFAAALGLVVVDQSAPGSPVPELSTLPAARLRSWLREHGGTAAEVIDDDSMFAFFEPVVRTDLRMAEAYVHDLEPLRSPLVLVRGPGRAGADADLAAWTLDASGPIRVIETAVAGGLLGSDPRELAAVLKQSMQHLAQRIPEESRP